MADRNNWDNIRAAYGRGLNDQQIAKRFHVTDRSIRRHRTASAAAGDPWLRDADPVPDAPTDKADAPSSEPRDKAADNSTETAPKKPTSVTFIAGGKKVTEPLRNDEAAEPMAPISFDIADVTDEAIAQAMRGALFYALGEFNAGRIKPTMHQTHADVLASLITSGHKTIAASRDVAGKKSGIPSNEETKSTDNTLVIRHERLETVKIPVDEKGRKVS